MSYRILNVCWLAGALALAAASGASAMSHEDGKEAEAAAEPAMESETQQEAAGTETGEAAAGETRQEAAPGADATLARALITSGIVNREPVDELDTVDTGTERVFHFTEIRDGKGGRITHRWHHDGEVRAEVDFEVGGDRWRVWSSKQMRPEWTGAWRVEVVAADGTVLGETTFEYVAGESEQGTAEPPLGPGEADDGDADPAVNGDADPAEEG